MSQGNNYKDYATNNDTNGSSSQEQQAPPVYQQEEPEEIVQVVYQSTQNGSMVGVGSSLVRPLTSLGHQEPNYETSQPLSMLGGSVEIHQPLIEAEPLVPASSSQMRPTSTLPSVAEENSSTGTQASTYTQGVAENGSIPGGEAPSSIIQPSSNDEFNSINEQPVGYYPIEGEYGDQSQQQIQYYQQQHQQQMAQNSNAIYSTVNKNQARQMRDQANQYASGDTANQQQPAPSPGLELYQESSTIDGGSQTQAEDEGSLYSGLYYNNQAPTSDGFGPPESEASTLQVKHSIISEEDELNNRNLMGVIETENHEPSSSSYDDQQKAPEEIAENLEEDISHILSRQKGGAAESGSFRNNFRKKKLGVSISTNENELTTYRQKFFETQEANSVDVGGGKNNGAGEEELDEGEEIGSLPKFKRNHSVSFNVSRGARHSIDIRNLPSYLTVKRASIVDVAKGAMSSIMSSFGSGGGSSAGGSVRRDSSPDEEPIFEEPIAPTLSLGQRVALVKNSGAEFGTVGWIGQLPDIDDDWIVGVIFDNMIGDCDGAYNGTRYFYARENYAMFVPLSSLTKTDNYIGRPETGTMLSRMSVSLKPGQLISVQRSSIRLQHCFLNAPHQRVGHDVRAVSNRLHCQCHNCGPCAHLTKQGRVSAIPPFGAHHAPNKKNSLAHAAVEILAHHHHHYHEEEHKDHEEYQFGDNAAHACNFVRYSCCQQNGIAGHDFSSDCRMVRPELLDNLIHAPRAPHRRSRPRRVRRAHRSALQQQQQQQAQLTGSLANGAMGLEHSGVTNWAIEDGNEKTWTGQDSTLQRTDGSGESSYSSRSSSISSNSSNADGGNINQQQVAVNYNYETMSSYKPDGVNLYNTIDSRMSIMDQQRFIYQRDSSSFLHSRPPSNLHYDDHEPGPSIGSSIKSCFNCILGRKKRKGKKSKRRHQSARNRMIEYRRKQSTFVPSTLAKPQEDFAASHGIMMQSTIISQAPARSNSDYSSFSNDSSPSKSPGRFNQQVGVGIEMDASQQQTFTLEHKSFQNNEQQLKSSRTYTGDHSLGQQTLNYDDYCFSDGSYKKNNSSHESALTDLGYYDNSSEDTLKQLVDQAINEEVARPEPINLADVDDLAEISPILSHESNSHNLDEHDVSSPTVSVVDNEIEEDVCHNIGCLDLNEQNDAFES